MLELPKIVEIEPTYTCNLRCRMCHVSFMPEEPRPSLRASVLERLRILRGAHVIIGSGFEPMMNREFAQIIRELIKMDTALEVITNGTLLSNENLSALRDANVRILNFSVDGIQPQTYEHIRRGASFTSTITNILRAREQLD